jgi:hypothetical protein
MLELLSLDLDVQQVAREVVAGIGHVLFHLGDEVLLDRRELLDPLLERMVDPLEHDVDEVNEPLDVVLGEAEHRADDTGRDVLRVGHPRVDDVALEAVDQFHAEGADHRLEGVDRSRGEGREDEPSRDRVERGVRGDGRRDADRRREVQFRGAAVADDDGSTGEVLRVLGDRGHAGVGRGEPTAAVALGVRHRAALAQVLPDRVGIGHPLGIGVIPLGGEVLDEGLVGHCHSSMKIACSGQLAWASWASFMVSSLSVPSPMTTPLPRSSKLKRLGAIEKQRPCPWHISGSILTFTGIPPNPACRDLTTR